MGQSSFVGRDFFGDRGYSAAPVYLADLDRCTPAEAVGPPSRRGRWSVYDYETEGFSGSVLMAGPETEAPEITYPLEVKGWHAVSIGLHPSDGEQTERPHLLARLTGDDTFTDIYWHGNGHHLSRQRLEEVFWKAADLSGQQIVFRQYSRRVMPGDAPGAIECSAARIAYIKLVPLSDPEVAALRSERDDRSTKTLYAHNDSFSFHNSLRPTTAEEIRRQVEPYRNTDFSRMYWEMGSGDIAHYPSKIAHTWSDSEVQDDFQRLGDRLRHESWRGLREGGVDPFQVALDHTHEAGMEFHAAYRLAGWTYPPPLLDYQWVGGFYESHPEWHCIDREGRNVPRMSYVYREVQDYAIAFLREVVATYDVEGVCLLYNRRPPYIDHEEPVIEGFKAEYGKDPRDLDERDERWLMYKAGIITAFMRRVRSEMEAAARERGKRIDIGACVLGKEEDNLYFALDVDAWVKEGLIDTLIPYSPAPLAMPVASDTWATADQIAPFVKAVEGSPVVMAANIMPRQMSPEEFRRNASMLYGAGVERLFFWDCNGRCNYKPSWNALRRMGHRDEIEGWRASGEPDLGAPLTRLRTLGGWHMGAIAPG